VHSFSLYINKYIIVLFSGNAEFSGNYSDPDANIVCAKKRKIESEKEREREREEWEWGDVSGLTKGANMSYLGGNYCDKGCRKERQIKEKVKFALYVG